MAPTSRARVREGRGAEGRARARGSSATAPRFNNCVEGAVRIARFARREAVESDGHRDRSAGCASCATRLCGALWGSGRPPRGGRRRSFVGGNRAMLAAPKSAPRAGVRYVGRQRHPQRRRSGASLVLVFPIGPCPTWPPRSSGRPTRHSPSHGDISAGPSRSSGRPTRHSPSHGDISAGPPRSGGRPTRHSPPHGDIDDADVAAAVAGRAARLSYGVSPSVVLKDQRFRAGVSLYGADVSRARARGARR